jgi:hypothetical protein
MSAHAASPGTKADFYAKVNEKFYDEVKKENGGQLPANLLDADGNPRNLTTSTADRAYRKRWLAIAARERHSKAIPQKEVETVCIPCMLKAAGAKIPPILLPSKKDGTPTPLTFSTSSEPPKTKKRRQKEAPCKNETLEIECGHAEKRDFKLKLPPEGESPAVTQFEVIDDGKEKITCTTHTTGPCATHAGKVFDLYPDDGVSSKANDKLVFRAIHDPELASTPFLELFSGAASVPHTYSISTDTCQQEESLAATVLVYPQIDWDVNIKIGAITGKHAIKKEKNEASAPVVDERKHEISFSGKFSVTICGSPIEYGAEITADLHKAIQPVNLASKAARFAKEIAEVLGGVEIEFDYPALTFEGKWGRREIEGSPRCGFGSDLSIGLSPLIGASVKIDILSFALAKIPGVGQVIERLRKSVKDAIDIAIFLKLKGGLDGAFHYKKVAGHPGDASGKLDGKLEFTVEAHVETEQFRWFCIHAGAGAKVGGHAGLSGTAVAGSDGEGGYYIGLLKFDGLTIYAVVAGGVGIGWDDPPADREMYDTPEGTEEQGLAMESKVDASGVGDSVVYKATHEVFKEQTLLGGEEKHHFAKTNQED